jgi:hypothetical protein
MLPTFEVAFVVQQINTYIASSSNFAPSTSIVSPSTNHDQSLTIVAKFHPKKKQIEYDVHHKFQTIQTAKYKWAESVVGRMNLLYSKLQGVYMNRT